MARFWKVERKPVTKGGRGGGGAEFQSSESCAKRFNKSIHFSIKISFLINRGPRQYFLTGKHIKSNVIISEIK